MIYKIIRTDIIDYNILKIGIRFEWLMIND